MTKRLAWPVVSVVAVGAVILVLAGTRQGPGLYGDAGTYISGARNLAAGRGYVNFSLQPITTFPPGFPVILALADRIGLGAADGARWLNAFAYGALVVLTFLLARRHVRREWLAVAAAAAVGFSPPLLRVFTPAWTEPVFCVLVVGLLLTLESVLIKRGHDPYMIMVAGLLASIGFAYRYVGVALLVLSILVVVIAAWRDGMGAVVRRTALFLVVASVLPALIIVRNLSEGSAFGRRPPSAETLGGIISELRRTAHGWVLAGRDLPLHLANVALAGALAIAVLGFVVAVRKYGFLGNTPNGAPLLPLAAVLVGYVAYVVVTALQTSIDPINNRLLSPIFAPAVVLMAISVEQLLDLDWISNRRWVVQGTAALMLLWLVVALTHSVNQAGLDGDSGVGYAARSWLHSDFAAAARTLPSTARVYSNTPDGLYFAAVKQPIYRSPEAQFYRSNARTNQLADFRREVRRSRANVYLAWATPNPGANLVSLVALRRSGLRLERVATAKDGSIYRVTVP